MSLGDFSFLNEPCLSDCYLTGRTVEGNNSNALSLGDLKKKLEEFVPHQPLLTVLANLRFRFPVITYLMQETLGFLSSPCSV